MDSKPMTNTMNIINSKDLFARINWLEQQLNYRCSDGYSEELKALKALAINLEDSASFSTYDEGSHLIHDSYLEDYKKAMQEPDKDKGKYSPVDFNGETYWLRRG
ncbi:MAG TPA: hypothetical protein VJ734_05755 [Nitrosospira sp.]|nr:hypothetical protein [Nitrosospira sp.]